MSVVRERVVTHQAACTDCGASRDLPGHDDQKSGGDVTLW
jgi:hypothetical protein